MSDLLPAVLDAHGGIDAFARARTLTARMSFGGPFWAARGWPGVLDDVAVGIDTTREHITFDPYPTADARAEFTVDAGGAETLRILGRDGRVVDERRDPRPGFPAYDRAVRWDAIQTCYFASTATWNYLMEPFLFARPDVVSREVDPWVERVEDGEQTWRRLAVTFPAALPNHNPEQVFYFDDRFLMRRMDYRPEVTASPIAHYTHEPRVFDGLVFYAKRRVHPRRPDGTADTSLAVITVDTSAVTTS